MKTVTIDLNFIERDTVLACLKDLITIKKRFVEFAQTPEEQNLCVAQVKVAQELYDKIYAQKVEEFKNGF